MIQRKFFQVGDIAPGTPVPQFHGQGGPGAGGDAFGVGHNAVPNAPQGYGNGNAQFASAGIAGQAGAQWNTTFGKTIFEYGKIAFIIRCKAHNKIICEYFRSRSSAK